MDSNDSAPESPEPKMTWSDLHGRLIDVFKEFGVCFTCEEDNDGQVVIYTGLMEQKGGVLIPYVES